MKLKEILNGELFCDGDWVESKDQDPALKQSEDLFNSLLQRAFKGELIKD